MLTSFKAMDATLKYAQFLDIGIPGKDNFDYIEVQYTQCIGSRPVRPKSISRGISFDWYTIFVSYNFIVLN